MRIDRHFILIALLVICVATGLGMLLGYVSVPKHVPTDISVVSDVPEVPVEEIQLGHNTRVHVNIGPGTHLPSVLKELTYAIESEIYSFVLSTPLSDQNEQREILFNTLSQIQKLHEKVGVTLALNCNPSAAWLRDHPDDTSSEKIQGMAFPSIGSEAWIAWAQTELTSMLKTFDDYIQSGFIKGVTLEALEGGHWTRSPLYEQSPVHLEAFHAWLVDEYGSFDTLKESWGYDGEDWDSVTIPVKVTLDAIQPIFYTHDTHASIIEYHRFLNKTTAETINALASTVKEHTPDGFTVSVPYGNVLEYPAAASGNWGVGALDTSVVDSLSTFPQTKEKGMGHHAFFAAPPYKDQSWQSLDSIYTGIQYDSTLDEIQVTGTYQPQQINKLMTRNAAIHSIYNVDWSWSDALGQGSLAHPPLWVHLKETLGLRTALNAQAGENYAKPSLTVVLDEASMHYVWDENFVGSLLTSVQASVLSAGIEVEWTTLEALLGDSETHPSTVYLFPNLFYITAENRDVLHAKFIEEEATAIWLYAPGFLTSESGVEEVSLLTGVKTERRGPKAHSGSKFEFSGTWIEQDQLFGNDNNRLLLLKSVDEQADPLARYQDKDDISAAMKYLETGWTSIVHYEPHFTPEFLHDILQILEIPLHLSDITIESPEFIYTNSNFTLIHSSTDSKVQIDFDEAYDIKNLLNTQQGWNNTRYVDIALSAGDSVILEFHPLNIP